MTRVNGHGPQTADLTALSELDRFRALFAGVQVTLDPTTVVELVEISVPSIDENGGTVATIQRVAQEWRVLPTGPVVVFWTADQLDKLARQYAQLAGVVRTGIVPATEADLRSIR